VVSFVKYQGAGNDFVLIDDRSRSFDETNTGLVKAMCDRHFGIGADGLMLLREHSDYDFEMVYFNSDGNLSSMCGNGGRCIVKFASDLGLISEHCSFIAVDGPHKATLVSSESISLEMKDVDSIRKYDTNSFVLDTGSPHFVRFIEDIENMDLQSEAKAIRYNDEFNEAGINVNFCSWNGELLSIRTYERGVEDETLACGTGVTAAALALNQYHGVLSPVEVRAVGGELSVSFELQNEAYVNIWKTGPARKVFSGHW